MLPGAGFKSSGFRDDVRGFRKKNQPLRLFMQYGPYAAVLELVLLLVVVVTMNASIRHGNQQIAGLKQRIETQQSENRNLLTSVQGERQSRTGAETRLHEANNKFETSQKELDHLRSTSTQHEEHCKSLQDSFDRTRLSLEAERDAALMERNIANQRVTSLQDALALRDREIIEHKHRTLEEHSHKDAQHASKEAEWEAMRNALESQVRAQGGYVPLNPPPPPPDGAGQQQQHQDYAAQTGSGVFHPTRSGLRERFIDSAEDLEFEGVVDPNGRAHLAQLLGHLYDIKLAEHANLEASHPGQAANPSPPIGHWMAQTLEGMGITCKHGTVHMAYILDRHFSLENPSGMVGRTADDLRSAGGLSSDASSQAGGRKDLGDVQEQQQQAVDTRPDGGVQEVPESMSTPGVVDPEQPEPERQRNIAWRKRNQRHYQKQKVDAAGFV